MKYKVKQIGDTLVLTSSDIQIGDKIQAKDGSGSSIITEFKRVFAKGEITTSIGESKEGAITYSQLENDWLKVIGEISPEATWVKEGDEFDEDEVEGVLYNRKHPDESIYGFTVEKLLAWIKLNPMPEKYQVIFHIKGKCGHFH